MSGGWDGAGSFSISVDMSANDAAGINIVSSAFSNQTDEIKAGINNCLTKDGQNSPSADLPMATKKHTGVGKATAVTHYIRAQEWFENSPRYLTDTDTGSTTISASAAYFPASATAGLGFYIRMGQTKPSASADEIVIRVNSVTMSATMANGDPLVPGALVSGGIYEFIYDGSKARCQNPSTSIKKYIPVWKCRAAADASVTVLANPTMTILAGFKDDILFIAKESNANTAMVFSVSTGREIIWSAPPSYLLADVTAVATGFTIYTSAGGAGTERAAHLISNAAQNRITIKPATQANLDAAVNVQPFSLTLARRRTI